MAASKSVDQRKMEQLDRVHELKAEQLAGNLPQVPANKSKTGQTVNEHEADGYVHIETKKYHPNPSNPRVPVTEQRIHKMHKDEFEGAIKNRFFELFDDVEVIHDPRDNAPSEYELRPGKMQVPATNNEQLNTATARKAITEKQKELVAKEKELLVKQAELEAREEALKAK